MPGFSVFTRDDGTIRHSYSGEMSGDMADPGQDPRGRRRDGSSLVDVDYIREGRGTDWYPKLDYGHKD